MATRAELTAAGLRSITNATCAGSALDLGATVTGWTPNGQPDVLFLSREALVAEGDDFVKRLGVVLEEIGNRASLLAMAEAARGQAKPDSVRRIANVCLEVAA